MFWCDGMMVFLGGNIREGVLFHAAQFALQRFLAGHVSVVVDVAHGAGGIADVDVGDAAMGEEVEDRTVRLGREGQRQVVAAPVRENRCLALGPRYAGHAEERIAGMRQVETVQHRQLLLTVRTLRAEEDDDARLAAKALVVQPAAVVHRHPEGRQPVAHLHLGSGRCALLCLVDARCQQAEYR